MSFDRKNLSNMIKTLVSIPFDQGNVFRLAYNSLFAYVDEVSIPFDQGNVFRRRNPGNDTWDVAVSIPFDQGNVFRLINVLSEGKRF